MEFKDFEYKEICLMDGLNTNSDDFLSNGFHQFYNEFQDDHLDFEPCVTTSWTGDIPIVDDHDYHKNGWTDVATVDFHQNDYSENYTTLDLDYILMDLPFESNHNLLELPEKTPLCNDSCSFFLKESAENLKLSNPVVVIDIPQNNSNDEESSDPSNNDKQSKTDLKPLICDFEGCGKSYAKPTHLKAHLKRHLNEKPYICHWPECKWRFSRSDELARHRRSHLGIKPYNCCFCTKSFARSDHLTKHRRVHEKKFNAMCKGERQTIIWPAVPRGRPGRKPKSKTVANDQITA